MTSWNEARRWNTVACATGKRSWETRRGAKQSTKAARRNGFDRMDVYHCVTCRYWHMGHSWRVGK